MIEVGKTYVIKPTKRNYLRQDVETTIKVTEVRTRETGDKRKPTEVTCVVGIMDNDERYPRYLYHVDEIGKEVKPG